MVMIRFIRENNTTTDLKHLYLYIS